MLFLVCNSELAFFKMGENKQYLTEHSITRYRGSMRCTNVRFNCNKYSNILL